jgi:hypothetical protein
MRDLIDETTYCNTEQLEKRWSRFLKLCRGVRVSGFNGNSDSASSEAVAAIVYVASRGAKAFHREKCNRAGSIAPQNHVVFSTREDAFKAHNPCRVCKP